MRNCSNHRLCNAFNVCGIFRCLEACAMRGQISALWVIRKVDFLEVVRGSPSPSFFTALEICSIFWKFEVCTMHSELCSLWVLGKVNFSTVRQGSSDHRFYNVCGVRGIFGTF